MAFGDAGRLATYLAQAAMDAWVKKDKPVSENNYKDEATRDVLAKEIADNILNCAREFNNLVTAGYHLGLRVKVTGDSNVSMPQSVNDSPLGNMLRVEVFKIHGEYPKYD